MDSGNSGGVQSSSCGSEEFDSRADSISDFFISNPSSHIGHDPSGIQQPPSQLPVMQQQHHHHLLDALSNYFDHPLPSVTNPNSQLNLDEIWSKNIRSEPNCNDLGGGFMASQLAQSRDTFSPVQTPQGPESGMKASVSGTTDQPNKNNNNNNNNMVRNTKKRSRASPRAPTTVLTTDTTNFRAMVQEFTGIPAPPFTSSPLARTRLDLFGTSSTMRWTQLDPCSPHFLLRPFAQKLHYSPPLISSSTASSSMVDAIASTPSTNSTSTTSINYQLPSELGLLKQLPQNALNNINMQNPILNFVSLLQATPKYPLPNPTGSLDVPSNESPLKMGVFEEFGLSQGYGNTNLGRVQNMVPSSDIGPLPINDNSANPSSWGEPTGTQEHDQSVLRSINGGYNSNTQRVVTDEDFRGHKEPEL